MLSCAAPAITTPNRVKSKTMKIPSKTMKIPSKTMKFS